jgi:hypothetical protein
MCLRSFLFTEFLSNIAPYVDTYRIQCVIYTRHIIAINTGPLPSPLNSPCNIESCLHTYTLHAYTVFGVKAAVNFHVIYKRKKLKKHFLDCLLFFYLFIDQQMLFLTHTQKAVSENRPMMSSAVQSQGSSPGNFFPFSQFFFLSLKRNSKSGIF